MAFSDCKDEAICRAQGTLPCITFANFLRVPQTVEPRRGGAKEAQPKMGRQSPRWSPPAPPLVVMVVGSLVEGDPQPAGWFCIGADRQNAVRRRLRLDHRRRSNISIMRHQCGTYWRLGTRNSARDHVIVGRSVGRRARRRARR